MAEHQIENNNNTQPQATKKGHPFLVVGLAVLLLAALSLLPWSHITNNQIKDFDLLADLWPKNEADTLGAGDEIIDPEVLALMEDTVLVIDDVSPAVYHQTVVTRPAATTDSVQPVEADTIEPVPVPPTKNPRVGGNMVIEDYTPDASGLHHLKSALAQSGSRPVRIGVIGDSYIEGDIFTADLREQLQNRYGGRGVGYMPANSQVSGFRPTVKQSSSGWTHFPIQKASKGKHFPLAGEYYTSTKGANVKYKGTNYMRHLAGWNASKLLFIAPQAGQLTITTDSGTETFDIQPSDAVQAIFMPGETSQLVVKSDISDLILLGAWIEDSNGVVVDCMSIRGDSGISHRYINPQLAAQMREYVDYDLIIIEYGINALTSNQTNYSKYGQTMQSVIRRVRECYPNADIILMGIGDRGHKVKGEAVSMSTAKNMIDAQREAARQAGVLFYDTRESMGGDGAIVNWRNNKMANGDYIHLNFKGGKALATTFVDALMRKVSE